jgi:hypothetical protein
MASSSYPFSPGQLILQNASPSYGISFYKSTGASMFSMTDSAWQMYTSILPSPGGLYSLGGPSNPWQEVYLNSSGSGYTAVGSASTGNRTFSFSDSSLGFAPIIKAVTTTSASSDTFTIQGLTASSVCGISAGNASAATNIATAYQSSVTTNSITLAHAATASMVYNLVCSY